MVAQTQIITIMYAVTTIRINNETGVFENTEVSKFMLEGDVEQEILSNGGSIDELMSMVKGQSKTFEATITNGIQRGTRFMYVHKF